MIDEHATLKRIANKIIFYYGTISLTKKKMSNSIKKCLAGFFEHFKVVDKVTSRSVCVS